MNILTFFKSLFKPKIEICLVEHNGFYHVTYNNSPLTATFTANKEKAFETIKEALAIDPEDDFTHTNYAWHFLEKGKHKDARKHFREALRINPNNSRARQGYKESLKSNLPPYRWMLMFSLWLSSKSKKVK